MTIVASLLVEEYIGSSSSSLLDSDVSSCSSNRIESPFGFSFYKQSIHGCNMTCLQRHVQRRNRFRVLSVDGVPTVLLQLPFILRRIRSRHFGNYRLSGRIYIIFRLRVV